MSAWNLFATRMAQLAELVQDVPSVFPLPRDPDDAKYVDLAAAGKAAFIVTRDKDLLDLMEDTTFRATYPNIAILSPTGFLEHVRAQVAKGAG